MRPFFILGSILIVIVGCRSDTRPPPVAAAAPLPHEYDVNAKMQEWARDNAPADRARREREEATIAALRTVNVGDTYETFERKTAPARIVKQQTSSSADGRVEHYVFVDNDTKRFTLYVAGGKVVNFVAVGFDLGK